MIKIVAVTLFTIFAITTHACDTPVFRYALEKWAPENYRMLVFSEEERNEETDAVLSVLDKNSVNIAIKEINLTELKNGFDAEQYKFKGVKKEYRKSKEQIKCERTLKTERYKFDRNLEEYNKFAKNKKLPYAVLSYPKNARVSKNILWQGAPRNDVITSINQSPARTEIAKRILSGDSAVWVVVTCEDKKKNDALCSNLESYLKKAEGTVTLAIPEDAKKLKLETPLKLQFSILKISSTSTKESFLINNLLKLSEKQNGKPLTSEEWKLLLEQPVIIPIIGRGRAIQLFKANEITEKAVVDLCQYICGECSCEIKAQNPGMDMLFAIDWESGFTPMVVDHDFPVELTGFSDFNFNPTSENPTNPICADEKRGVESTSSQGRNHLLTTLGVVMGILIVTVSGGTVFILKKK